MSSGHAARVSVFGASLHLSTSASKIADVIVDISMPTGPRGKALARA
jgi:hypothetical protein